MKTQCILLCCLALTVSCNRTNNHGAEETAKPVVIRQEKSNESLAEVAYDLLKFEKYSVALSLVQDDTSGTATAVKILANDGLGNVLDAIDWAIVDLRQQDSADFYEGTWELVELYEIFKKDVTYGLGCLQTEYARCNRNYQVRLLMMKLYWYIGDYEKVIALGDEFREELPDMSSEVTFNAWRQDALDSLRVHDRKIN